MHTTIPAKEHQSHNEPIATTVHVSQQEEHLLVHGDRKKHAGIVTRFQKTIRELRSKGASTTILGTVKAVWEQTQWRDIHLSAIGFSEVVSCETLQSYTNR